LLSAFRFQLFTLSFFLLLFDFGFYLFAFSFSLFPGTALRALQGRCAFCFLPFAFPAALYQPNHLSRPPSIP
jgi:hypothetical protein